MEMLRNCRGCLDSYDASDLHYGYCEDCYSNIADGTLEQQVDAGLEPSEVLIDMMGFTDDF